MVKKNKTMHELVNHMTRFTKEEGKPYTTRRVRSSIRSFSKIALSVGDMSKNQSKIIHSHMKVMESMVREKLGKLM